VPHRFPQGFHVGRVFGRDRLWEAEQLTATLSLSMRRQLRLPRRLADMTARDALCQLDIGELRSALHRLVRLERALARASRPG